MPGPKRRPVAHAAVTAIPPEAVRIYRRMKRLRCSCQAPIRGSTLTPTDDLCPQCERWYRHLSALSTLLPHKPWDHPLLMPISLDAEFDHERALYTGKMVRARVPTRKMIALEAALRAADRALKRARARLVSSTADIELPTTST